MELLKEREIEGGGKLNVYRNGLMILKAGEQTSEHVDAWYEVLEKMYENWYDERAITLLFDATTGMITPYFRQKMMALRALAQADSLATYTAILVTDDNKRELDVIANISSLGSKQRLRIFTDYQEAMNWLGEALH